MRPLSATRVLASGVFTGKQQHQTSAITPGAPAQIYERHEYLFRVFVICLRVATMCGKFRAQNLLLSELLPSVGRLAMGLHVSRQTWRRPAKNDTRGRVRRGPNVPSKQRCNGTCAPAAHRLEAGSA
jgi:hypothetical protein